MILHSLAPKTTTGYTWNLGAVEVINGYVTMIIFGVSQLMEVTTI
jgi:hypothetical protein